MQKIAQKHKLWLGLIFAGLLALAGSFILLTRKPASIEAGLPTPLPTLDRLAEPPLSQNPTQLEWGRHLFWLNCMPCHGERGQGLTEEFRALYIEDQDCWARGCHGGRVEDQGFPIPRSVPAIISATGGLPPFGTAEQLFEYLRATHPPQHPGYLPDDEYWALTAYLMDQNHRLQPAQVLGP